jgi:hypothetical protein
MPPQKLSAVSLLLSAKTILTSYATTYPFLDIQEYSKKGSLSTSPKQSALSFL